HNDLASMWRLQSRQTARFTPSAAPILPRVMGFLWPSTLISLSSGPPRCEAISMMAVASLCHREDNCRQTAHLAAAELGRISEWTRERTNRDQVASSMIPPLHR